jgi:hypothetical protein
MKLPNVKELNAQFISRQTRRHVCFEKTLEGCSSFIKKHADKNATVCFYVVPEFLIGYPLYDINECITYIKDKLEKSGFLIKYYFPRILYISWNVNEIKENKMNKDISMIKTLEGKGQKKVMKPKQPTGNRIKFADTEFIDSVKEFKPSGKIVLNLA